MTQSTNNIKDTPLVTQFTQAETTQKIQSQLKSQVVNGRVVTPIGLAQAAKPGSMESAAKVASHFASSCEAFRPQGASPSVMPKVNVPIEVTYTCEEAEKAIRGSIAKLKTSVDYNGFHAVTSFIDSFNQMLKGDPKISEFEAFKKFKPDSREEIRGSKGGACVGVAYAISQTLEEDNVRVQGQPVVAYTITKSKLGDEQPDDHAAAFIPCKDGVIVVELTWDDPLIVIKGNTGLSKVMGPFRDDFEIVKIPGRTYKSNKPIITHVSSAKGKSKYFEYRLVPTQDPDDSVIKHWLLDAKSYPATASNDKGVDQSVIKFDLKRGTVVFQNQPVEDDRVSIKFKDLAFDENGGIKNPEYHQFIKTHPQYLSYFKTNMNTIMKQISVMAKNSENLLNLHLENILNQLKEDFKKGDGKIAPDLLTSLGQLIQHSNLNDRLKKFFLSLNFSPQEIALIKNKVIDMQKFWDKLRPLNHKKQKILDKYEEKTFYDVHAFRFNPDQLNFIKKYNCLNDFDKGFIEVIRSLSPTQLAFVDKYGIVDKQFAVEQIAILEKLPEADLDFFLHTKDVWNPSNLVQLDALSWMS